MNTLANKPVKNKRITKSGNQNKQHEVEIDEKKLIEAIYKHYGKPENIVQEKLSIYRAYRSPAGYAVEDWCIGGWQRGRFSVYTEHPLLEKDGSDTGLKKNIIEAEGKGSWFFMTDGTHVKVFIGKNCDAILEM
tara:strand:+ start:2176 stop:2577 length:402 start_codon:yes stop_codon:yes gene_type:complete